MLEVEVEECHSPPLPDHDPAEEEEEEGQEMVSLMTGVDQEPGGVH